jgi:peptidyl-dipeptidase Dcp
MHKKTIDDPIEFERSILERIDVPKELMPRHGSTHFLHVFGSYSYASKYYCYLWAEVLADDIFDSFIRATGPYDQDVAERLRTYILSVGGSIEHGRTYREFMGRDPSVNPLMKRRGFDV